MLWKVPRWTSNDEASLNTCYLFMIYFYKFKSLDRLDQQPIDRSHISLSVICLHPRLQLQL